MTSVADAKAQLRSAMRARRSGLDPADVAAAGAALAQRLESLPLITEARRVAAYRAVRGEIPVDALLHGAGRQRYTLPRVVGDHLEFVAWRRDQKFVSGAFGIPEPVDGEVVALADHDAVLVPLIAFDGRCRRLGQGGGFYDRALARLGSVTGGQRPVLVGVAYGFQQVDRVPQEPWDVPLDAVATDRDIILAG